MIISKKEAKKEGIISSSLCEFHLHNPDQTASMYECEKCKIIQDICGCGEDDYCDECSEEKRRARA